METQMRQTMQDDSAKQAGMPAVPGESISHGQEGATPSNTPRVVSIVGPTASGKTGLGIAIAKTLAERGERAEIVNADAYQMYRGMDIGTAKPTAEEQAEVPHHLIDIIDPDDTMSVARFQTLARDCINDLQSQGGD